MLLLNNALAFSAALASLVSTTTAAPAQQSKSLNTRENDWDSYHSGNEAYARQGLCRAYLDPSPRDGLWPCRQYCPEGTQTFSCFSPGNPNDAPWTIESNPDGERYVLGQCSCENFELANIIMDFTAIGLDKAFRDLGSITCGLFLQASKEAVLAASYFIPGGGQTAMAARTMAKAAKAINKSQGGKDIWGQFVRDTCQMIGGQNEEVDAAFDLFLGAPDDY